MSGIIHGILLLMFFVALIKGLTVLQAHLEDRFGLKTRMMERRKWRRMKGGIQVSTLKVLMQTCNVSGCFWGIHSNCPYHL